MGRSDLPRWASGGGADVVVPVWRRDAGQRRKLRAVT